MPRKFRAFGRDIVIGKRLFGIGKEDDYWGMINLLGNDTKQFELLDAYKGLVYACINRIAETYATYDPHVERKQGKEWQAIDDHPILNLIRNPGGYDPNRAAPITFFDILYATASFIELQGDCYWYLPGGNISGQPREIVVLRADKVGKVLDKEGKITGYFVRTNGGADKIPLELREVLPFIGFNPKDPYKGLSTTEAGADYIETDQSSTKFTKNFFKNNAGISGVLSIKGEVGRGAFRKIVRAWREKYQGVDNAGKVMMVRESDAAFTKVGLGLNELDMAALRKMSVDDICVMYGVPRALLALSDEAGLGRGNVETFEYIFAKYTIEPKMKRLDAVLNFALLRYYGEDNTKTRMSHANIIPEDKEFILAEREKGIYKWITPNEIRAQEGDEDKEGGDDLYIDMRNMPLADAGAVSAANQAQAASTSSIKLKLTRTVTTPTKKKDLINSVAKENFRLRLMRNQTLYERRYKKKFKPILEDQRKDVLFNLTAHASTLSKAFSQKLFDDAAYDAKMLQELKPLLVGLGEEQGSLALLFAGDDESDFRMTAPYEKFITESTKKMASRFNDDTLERLNKTLAEGIQEGENLDKLTTRVNGVYDMVSESQTERVARTETLKASNTATNEAYQQTGYVKEKQWYVNPDACPICEAFDGKTVGLDETFLRLGESLNYNDDSDEEQTYVADYEDVDVPPLHPNCRCTIIPVR